MARTLSSHTSSHAAASPGPQRGAGPRPLRWAVLGGVAVIALQLLVFDVVLERHARQAQAQAASYVSVTLGPRGSPAPVPAPALLLAAGQ